MNITLIAANYDAGRYRKGENLGIKALEAVIRSCGHKVYIYDRNFLDINDEDLIRLVEKNGSRIVGFSVSFTRQIYETIRLAKVMRDNLIDVHFTIGGQGVSFIIPKILEDNNFFDSGICFEGEETFLELIQHLEGNKNINDIKGLCYRFENRIVLNEYRNPVNNLDQFPFMYRKVLPKKIESGHVSLITSRGCTGKCLFCSSGYFSNRYHTSKRWRYRSAENVIQEIEKIKENYDELAISFVDDNFLGGLQEGYDRAKNFAKILIDKKIEIKWAIECRIDDVEYELFELMRRAGLMNVFLGVESGNEIDLKLFNKNISLAQIDKAINVLEELELTYNIGFIMFHPLSTEDQLIQNALFLKKYVQADSKNLLNELSLYHGSPLVKYYSSKNLICFDKYSIIYTYANYNVEQILKFANKLLNRFSDIETQLNSLLFTMQNKYGKLDRWNNYKRCLELKKLLSDFEADVFIELCSASVNKNLNYDKLEAESNKFKETIKSEIILLQEE